MYADPVTDIFKDAFGFSSIFENNVILCIRCFLKKKQLEPVVVKHITSNDEFCYVYVYIAAHLKYQSAYIPVKKMLLENFSIYGWEGPDYEKVESYLDDVQYPWQIMCMKAIESITGKPIRESIALTEYEYRLLQKIRDTYIPVKKGTLLDSKAPIDKSITAYWMLKKFGYTVQLYR